LTVLIYIPIWDYEEDEVTEFYEIIEDIIKEDGRGEKNTITMMLEINHIETLLDHMDCE
jgi:hypothetical protein